MSSFQKINYKLDFIIQFRTHSDTTATKAYLTAKS